MNEMRVNYGKIQNKLTKQQPFTKTSIISVRHVTSASNGFGNKDIVSCVAI